MIAVRGIAVKIFASFWIVFAVLIASFAVLPSRGADFPMRDLVKQHATVAVDLLEHSGAGRCAEFAAVLERQWHIRLLLYDAREDAVCKAGGTPPRLLSAYRQDATRRPIVVPIRGASGATLTAVVDSSASLAGLIGRPPFPFAPVALAIVASGVVCFIVAAYLARPLRRVRDASYRLAAGDLQARAGAGLRARHDEIGELVRDFDTMAARIEALVQSQNQLLLDISHELRSPLARLNVALELARRRAGADAAADLDRIEREAERMNDLIGRVLALARAEHSGSTAHAAVDIHEIVREVTEDAAYEAQQRHASVVLAARARPIVSGDASLVASAFENVLRNALRYSPEQSSIEVAVDATERDAVITVRDRGAGVPEADLERIFFPFHRVEAARDRESGGIGLGLAIAQRAVAVHGGRIVAENAADGGLRVTIRMPRLQTQPRAV